MIDQFPSLGRDTLNVSIQRRFLEPLAGDSDTAEPPEAQRIHDMEGKCFVTEIEKGFYYSTTQNLISAHAICAGSFEHQFTLIQILQNMLTDGRIALDDAADHHQLLVLFVILNVGHEGHLFLPYFAHFVLCSFSLFVLI
jgi:hypothetical protein